MTQLQEVGESTPKASAISPKSAFTKRPSAAISELEPLAEVEGEGDGGLSEDPDAPEKGMPRLTGVIEQYSSLFRSGLAVVMLCPTFWLWNHMWVPLIKPPTTCCGRCGLSYGVSLFPAPHLGADSVGCDFARALTRSADVRSKGGEEGPHEDFASGTATPEYSASEAGSDSAPRERHECVICGITTTSAAHLEVKIPFQLDSLDRIVLMYRSRVGLAALFWHDALICSGCTSCGLCHGLSAHRAMLLA